MKKISFLLALLLTVSLAACAPQSGTEPGEGEADEYTELILDGNFAGGFNLYGPDSRYHAANYWEQVFFESEGNPFWKLDTWGCSPYRHKKG